MALLNSLVDVSTSQTKLALLDDMAYPVFGRYDLCLAFNPMAKWYKPPYA